MTPNVGFDCADAAVDRLRELNDGMNVWCVLVNWGSSTVLCDEVERVMQRRAVACQKPAVARLCADFYVSFHTPDTIRPCADPGGIHNQSNFNSVKLASGGHIYRLRNDVASLHLKPLITMTTIGTERAAAPNCPGGLPFGAKEV
jgi:hypothetical protein